MVIIADKPVGSFFENVKDIVVELAEELDPVSVPLPEVCGLELSGSVPTVKVDEFVNDIAFKCQLLAPLPELNQLIRTEAIGRLMPT